jgi:PPM family protein phosphatase
MPINTVTITPNVAHWTKPISKPPLVYASQPTRSRLAGWFMRRTAPSGVRRVAPLNAAVASDVGVVRKENQDRVAVVRAADRSGTPFVLAALADGIGGMKGGADAAAIALGVFIESVVAEAQYSDESGAWLRRAAQRADAAVHARYGGDGGSTLVATLIHKTQGVKWLSVGDSRVYQAHDGKLVQLSKDDTLEGQLGKPVEGGFSSDLLQFIGIGTSLEPHIEPALREEKSTMLLMSDGVHFANAEVLAQVVQHAEEPGLCVRRLTDLARMLGGPDNASVVALGLDPLAWDCEPLLDSSFEVWDAFGDLHEVVERLRRSPSTLPEDRAVAAGVPQSTPRPNPESATAVPQPTSEPSPVAESATGKKQKTKAAKKTRSKQNKQGDHQENEVPQLQIQFPNKIT